MKEFDDMRNLIEAVYNDVARAGEGNKAAGRRVRKAMQDVKRLAQAVRVACLAPPPPPGL